MQTLSLTGSPHVLGLVEGAPLKDLSKLLLLFIQK